MGELEPWLVQTKLHPPRLRDDLVLRQRLFERLGKEVVENPVTLIAAPAGYGKTTLLSSLPVILPKFQMAWISLDVDDNDPSCFLAAFRGALQFLDAGGANPEAASLLSPSLDLSRGDSTARLRRTIGSIINWIVASRSGPFIMVLDDLHVVREQAVLEMLDYLVSHMPPHMHLVIGTRHNPLHLRARLAARRQLGEVRHADLSFTVDETALLLRDSFGLQLSSPELAILHRHMEGWPAGLCLVANSLTRIATPEARTAFLNSLSRHGHDIFSFLGQEVLSKQPQEVRSFLLETSILTELSPELCKAVTGRGDSAAILESVYTQNLFTQATDKLAGDSSSGPTYRYHHLFGQFLRDRLDQEMPERVSELHERAARAERIPFRAIHHYTAAGLWDDVALQLEQFGWQAVQAGMFDTLFHWFQRLPQQVLDAHPRLYLFLSGAILVTTGNKGKYRELLQRMQRLCAEAGDRTAEGESLAMEAVFCLHNFGTDEVRTVVERTLGQKYAPNGLVQPLLVRTWLNCQSGHVERATNDFEAALSMGEESGDPLVLTAVGSYMEPFFLTMPGCLDRAEGFCRASLARVDEDNPGRLMFWDQLSFIHLWKGRPREALAAARTVLDAKERYGRHLPLGHIAFMYGGVSAEALGDPMLARHFFDQLLDTVEALPYRPYSDFHLYPLARTCWLEGRISDLQRILELCQRPTAGLADFPVRPIVCDMMTAMTAAAAGRSGQAERILRGVMEREGKVPIAAVFGSARLLLARVLLEAGRPKDALAEFGPVLQQCQRKGELGPVLLEGASILPVLRLAARSDGPASHAASVLGLLGMPAIGDAADERRRPEGEGKAPALSRHLTGREVDILRLLALGDSNKLMAKKLFISDETVKFYVASILRKLGVASRTQAALRARELDLGDS